MRETINALTRNPMQLVWRYVFGLMGGLFAMGLHVFLSYRGLGWFDPQRWGSALSSGLLFGHIFALLVILGNEYTRRLRGVWSFSLIVVVSLIVSLLIGAIAWITHHFFFLLNTSPDWRVLLLGAAAISFGLLLSAWFDIPVWFAMVIMFLSICAAIMISFQRYLATANSSNPAMALLYFAPNQSELMWVITVIFSFLLTLSAWIPLIWQRRTDHLSNAEVSL